MTDRPLSRGGFATVAPRLVGEELRGFPADMLAVAPLPPCVAVLHFVPRDGWLSWLARGWTFADALAPAPMAGPHGRYSVLMERKESR